MVKNSTEHSLATFLSKYDKIVIPDIQRDYVMGSGGEKLTKLLQSICNAKYQDTIHPQKEFKFSAIMGYVDIATNTFYVYDGQQRLASLVYLCASYKEAQSEEKFLSKFEFMNREEANLYLKGLIQNKENRLNVVDFTTFSLEKLLRQFSKDSWIEKYGYSSFEKKIGFKYLYEHVVFDVVPVKKVEDAEQFFIDLNDGLDLKEYEIFKSELFHKVRECNKEGFKNFALMIDNNWLRFFSKYKTLIPKDIEKPWELRMPGEEEIEIAFIQFCLRMMWVEKSGTDEGYINSNVDWIERKHTERLEKILSHMVELDLSDSKLDCVNFVNYSFGDRTERFKNEDIVNHVEGVFWNLADNNYKVMLKTFLLKFYDPTYKEFVKKDVIIWAYISNCEKSPEVLFPYMRFIKKLLNNNLIENHMAHLDSDKNMWYTKYSAFCIPKYYSRIDSFINNSNNSKLAYLYSTIKLNKDLDGQYNIGEHRSSNAELNKVLEDEHKRNYLNDKEELEAFENLPYVNGLINNLIDSQNKLLISYDEFLSDILRVNTSKIEILGGLFDKLGDLGYDLKPLYFEELTIRWKAYTKNFCYQKGNILLNTLNDLFIDNKFGQVICDWIIGSEKMKLDFNDDRLLLKAINYMPTRGWSTDSYQIYYPNDYYTYRDSYISVKDKKSGLCSNKGNNFSVTKKNIRDFFGELKLNEEGKVIVDDETGIHRGFIWSLEPLNDFLMKRLQSGEKNQKVIFFCKENWVYNMLLDEYIQNTENGLNEIKEWNEKGYVIKCFGEYFFINQDALNKYMEKKHYCF
ncbi:DUF262 domain-containing protein [Paenibacillus psychroresistens]|uniref:DUF262 domain-containing protein n=1 Tax=Paenibacillus psychroresistens TaxID=1778678 RepID=A0A6B8RR98_9BACL|nr:DUF262 domain-containing protein [Paenibacillus psychroresistens]QGQ97916.1 DUF262 domain-containing protein [Paenibacillus psychroresistens]